MAAASSFFCAAMIATPFALRDAAHEPLGFIRSSADYLTEAGGAGGVQQVDVVA